MTFSQGLRHVGPTPGQQIAGVAYGPSGVLLQRVAGSDHWLLGSGNDRNENVRQVRGDLWRNYLSAAGLMLWFRWKRLAGSYVALICARRT